VKPRLLDLFCGAGGCTKGYQEAGFYVVGVDIEPQPNYCGDEFVQADAIEWMLGLLDGPRPHQWYTLGDYAAIHASPPCQASSSLRTLHPKRDYPELIPLARELLIASGLPYVIENVPGAALLDPVLLEGQMFENLRTRRRRYFETNWPLQTPFLRHPCPAPHAPLGVKPKAHEWMHVSGHVNLPEAREAMGIDWMNQREIAQAIPPAYTKFIGEALISHLAAESRQAA
jgi:DNA (cytosine-5)-methyltransferase 1